MEQSMKSEMQTASSPNKMGWFMAIGLALGTGLAVLFSFSTRDFTLGLMLGPGMGFVIGTTVGALITSTEKPD